MIGDVGQGIGRLAVAFDHHAVFFVAESGASEPSRRLIALGGDVGNFFLTGAFPIGRLIDTAVIPQGFQHLPDFFGFKQAGLIEKGVVVDIDSGQRLFNPVKHTRFSDVFEMLPAFVLQGIAMRVDKFFGDVD